MLKAIILLGVSCPSAWALPTANIQKTLSSDAHNQNIVSSGTHDQKTLGQKTLSEDSHHQKIDDWTKTESETALLDARRKRFNVVSGCECQHDDWSTPDDEWSKECAQIDNCGATVERTRTKKWCKKYAGPWCVIHVRTLFAARSAAHVVRTSSRERVVLQPLAPRRSALPYDSLGPPPRVVQRRHYGGADMQCVSPALIAAIHPTDRLGQDHLGADRLGTLWRRNARLLQRNGEARAC